MLRAEPAADDQAAVAEQARRFEVVGFGPACRTVVARGQAGLVGNQDEKTQDEGRKGVTDRQCPTADREDGDRSERQEPDGDRQCMPPDDQGQLEYRTDGRFQ